MKKCGFSLIEILIVISLMAILAAGAAPTFSKMFSQQKFFDDTKNFFEMVVDARANAIAEKKCENKTSEFWKISINKNTKKYFLKCKNLDGEKILRTENFSENTNFEKMKLDDTEKNSAEIFFLSGSAQMKIKNSGENFRKIKIFFADARNSNSQKIFCADAIAGFPILSENENDCN